MTLFYWSRQHFQGLLAAEFSQTRMENYWVKSSNKFLCDLICPFVVESSSVSLQKLTLHLTREDACGTQSRFQILEPAPQENEKRRRKKENGFLSYISHLFSVCGAHLLTCFVKCYGVFPPRWLRRRLQRWDLWCRHGSYLQDRGLWRREKVRGSERREEECSFRSREEKREKETNGVLNLTGWCFCTDNGVQVGVKAVEVESPHAENSPHKIHCNRRQTELDVLVCDLSRGTINAKQEDHRKSLTNS